MNIIFPIHIAITISLLLTGCQYRHRHPYSQNLITPLEEVIHITKQKSDTLSSVQILSDKPEEQIRAYIDKGRIYILNELYSNAFQLFLSALKLAEQHQVTEVFPVIYNNLGVIYCAWLDPTQGAKYFMTGLAHTQPHKPHYNSLLINLIGAYCQMNNPVHAYKYLQILRKIPPTQLTTYYDLYYQGYIAQLTDKPDLARQKMLDALKYSEQEKLGQRQLASVCNILAELYECADPDSSIHYLNQALNYPEAPVYIQRESLKRIAELYKKRSIKDKYMYYLEQYVNLSDSLFNESEINRTKDLQLIYEREKTNEAITNQQNKIQIQQHILLLITVIAFIFCVLLFLLYKQKQDLNKSYQALFQRSNKILNMEKNYKQKQRELEERINELTQQYDHPDKTILEKPKPQYSVNKLSEEQKQEIRIAIESVMSDTEIICQCDFSIEQLAERTGYNTRYVSQVMNEYYQQNFRTVLNSYRIKEAERKLLNTAEYGNLTIQAIANSVGYKSHSNFILLFKKQVGITPSMYQKMAREQQILTDE